MIKSVWLSKLLVSQLNERGSVLNAYYEHLSGLIKLSRCLMCLMEPDGEISTYIYIFNGSACLLPFPNVDVDSAAFSKALDSKEPVFCKNALYVPMVFENISPFGCLIFTCSDIGFEDGKEDVKFAVTAFSSMVYTEAMASIIESFHDSVLSAKNLCVDYVTEDRTFRAVNNVNLEICEKEFTVIFGPSGCGKTSLLNAIGGMRLPSSGSVFWKGSDISHLSEKELTLYRRNTIGFIFQKYNLISDLTAGENIDIAASLVDNPLKTEAVLDLVGLSGKSDKYPSQLSGGEQQRVCIARALVKRAEFMLCDEPTGALDTENSLLITKILQSLAKEQGLPVVMITHNPNFAVLADSCITMCNGCITGNVIQPFPIQAKNMQLN